MFGMDQPTRRRLTRGHHRVFAGVAAGLAEYLDLDATLVRVLWVFVTIFALPASLFGYMVLMFVMPPSDAAAPLPAAVPGGAVPASARGKGPMLLGGVLVLVGALMLANGLSFLHWIGWGLPHVVVPA